MGGYCDCEDKETMNRALAGFIKNPLACELHEMVPPGGWVYRTLSLKDGK